eukprot:gene3177-3976_t
MNALNYNAGVVEGYYWTQSEPVNGQWGSYSFTQRKQLIQLLASNNLGFYWYAPQSINTMTLWDSTQLSQWNQTAQLANSLGVKVIYGLRPGWLSTDFSSILTRLLQIQSSGITLYSLNFDDAEGVATSQQQQREVQLVTYLKTNAPGMTLWGLTPYAYYQDMFSTKSQWNTALQTINGVSSTIPFIFTGKEITPSTMTTSQFPNLCSTRSCLWWDNWIAEDTNTRIPWGMVSGWAGGRIASNLFNSPYGYVLNLMFPLERAVHHIYCAGVLSSGTTTSCNVADVSQYWSNWLSSNGFLHGSQTVSSVASTLENAINDDIFFNSIADLEAHFPGLAQIFSTPPSI